MTPAGGSTPTRSEPVGAAVNGTNRLSRTPELALSRCGQSRRDFFFAVWEAEPTICRFSISSASRAMPPVPETPEFALREVLGDRKGRFLGFGTTGTFFMKRQESAETQPLIHHFSTAALPLRQLLLCPAGAVEEIGKRLVLERGGGP